MTQPGSHSNVTWLVVAGTLAVAGCMLGAVWMLRGGVTPLPITQEDENTVVRAHAFASFREGPGEIATHRESLRKYKRPSGERVLEYAYDGVEDPPLICCYRRISAANEEQARRLAEEQLAEATQRVGLEGPHNSHDSGLDVRLRLYESDASSPGFVFVRRRGTEVVVIAGANLEIAFLGVVGVQEFLLQVSP